MTDTDGQKPDQKTFEERQAANTNAARVRDLRVQIAYWQQQYAANPAANNNAPDIIAGLTNELNGIPDSGTIGG